MEKQESNQIQFTYDCREKKAALSAAGVHEYCATCKHNVYDLTHKSKAEIFHFLESNNGNLCGKFYLDQIRNTTEKPYLTPHILLAGIVTMMGLGAPNDVYAQERKPVRTEQHEIPFGVKLPHVENNINSGDITDSSTDADQVIQEKKEIKSRLILRLGSTHLYTTNRFPFLQFRKLRRGRMKNIKSF